MNHTWIGVLFLTVLLTGCAPCGYETGIVSGTVTDAADGLAVDGGSVQLIPTTGETLEATIFGSGLYEASVQAGSYEVVGYDVSGECFSAIFVIEVEPCDEITVDLQIIDCF